MGLFPLLLASDIERDALASVPISFDSQASAVEQAIADITSVIETFLHRKLAARKTVQVIPIGRWQYIYGFDYSQAYLAHYPLVQIVSVVNGSGEDITSRYSLHDVSKHQERMIKGPITFENVSVTAYTGYRRPDQTLTDLQGADTSLEDMTELPQALPSDIRSVLTECILNRLILASSGQMGSGQKVSSIGTEGVTLSSPDTSFVHKRLMYLADYRRVY